MISLHNTGVTQFLPSIAALALSALCLAPSSALAAITDVDGGITTNVTTSVNNGDATLYVGQNTAGNTLNIINGGQLYNVANVYLGDHAGANRNDVTISNGGVLTNSAAAYIGGLAGVTSNSVLVAGANSVWSMNTPSTSGYLWMEGADSSLTVSNGATVNAYYLIAGQSTGPVANSVVVTGSGSVMTNAGWTYVGANGESNTMTVSAGGAVMTAGIGIIGNAVGSAYNSALVTGTNSLWQCGSLFGGNSGSFNQLIITQGGTVNDTAQSYLGYASSNNYGLVTGLGSLWTNSADFYIGDGATANFNQLVISNGGVFVDLDGRIGNAGNNNSVLVTGAGSLWQNDNSVWVANEGSSNSIDVSNGGVVSQLFPTFNCYVGAGTGSSYNTVSVTGAGSTLTLGGSALTIGNTATCTNNVLTLANGGLLTNTTTVTLGGVSPTFNLGDGTLAATAAVDSVWLSVAGASLNINHGVLCAMMSGPLLVGSGGVNIAAGGLMVDSQSNSVTIGCALSGAGGLTKLGPGTLFLSASNNYTGLTTVSNGTLMVNGWLSGSVYVENGATLGGCGAIGGTVTVEPGGTLLRMGSGANLSTGGGSIATDARDWMIQKVVVNSATGQILVPGVDPYGPLPAGTSLRNLTEGEMLPYYKHDQPAPGYPNGYQRHDSFPVQDTGGNELFLNPFDYSPEFPAFNYSGDGYDLYLIRAGWASAGETRDGGGFSTTFPGQLNSLGPITPYNGWVFFPTNFTATGYVAGNCFMPITGWYWEHDGEPWTNEWSGAVPPGTGLSTQSETSWRLITNCPFGGINGNWVRTMDTIQVVHGYVPETINSNLWYYNMTQGHLEIFYFTQTYGITRWEVWVATNQLGGSLDSPSAARTSAISAATRGNPVPGEYDYYPQDTPQTPFIMTSYVDGYGETNPFVLTSIADWSAVTLMPALIPPSLSPLPNQNLLANFHFDQGFNNWQRAGSSLQGNAINWSTNQSKTALDTNYIQDGSNGGVRYLSFNANATPTGNEMFYQDIPITTRQSGYYTVSLQVLSEGGAGSLGLQLEQLDTNGSWTELDLDATETTSPTNSIYTYTGPTDTDANASVFLSSTWISTNCAITIKPQASRLRFAVLPQSTNTFDLVNANVTVTINHTMATPLPLGGGNYLLGFLGVNGTPYTLQSTTNLTPPITWTPLATNTANPTNGWVYFTNTFGVPQSFFRTHNPN